MARVQLPIVVLDIAGNAVQGASVRVKKRSDGTDATLYAAETGATTANNPVSTNTQGKTGVWLDRGAYNCTVTGTGIVTYTEPFDAAPGGDNAVDTTWASQVFPARVTTLPAAPFDGQIVAYVADATNGIVWMLKYNASSASSYKWEFLGGSDLSAEVTANITPTLTTSYVATSGGPTLTVPVAGEYRIKLGAEMPNVGAAAYVNYAVQLGAAAAVDTDSIRVYADTGGEINYLERTLNKRTLAAATALTTVIKISSGTPVANTIQNRYLAAVPIRVG